MEELRSMGSMSACDVSFVALKTAVFCVECELISANNTPRCLACGSLAVLSLSRVLGGSLSSGRARLIEDMELDRLVRDLLSTVPAVESESQPRLAASFSALAPGRHHARIGNSSDVRWNSLEFASADLDLEPAIQVIAERAQALTGATGSAIALRLGDEIVCRARTGRTAPDLGVRLQSDSGISAECVRSGEVVLCNDAERSLRVDLPICRRLGVRSILAAPLRHFRRTLGVFEVLSSTPYAFDQRDVATMQMLSGMMVAAMSRLSCIRSPRRQSA